MDGGPQYAEVLGQLRTYTLENLLYAQPDIELDDHAALLDSGLLDSLGIVELLDFLEETYGLRVPVEDIFEEHFSCLASIAQYVATKCDSNGRVVEQPGQSDAA